MESRWFLGAAHPDVYLALKAAHHVDAGHALDLGKGVLEHLVSILRISSTGMVSLYRAMESVGSSGVEFLDHRPVGVVRQVLGNGLDLSFTSRALMSTSTP